MRSFIFSVFTALVVVTAQALPSENVLDRRQAFSVSNPPKFITANGTIDIVNLIAASRIEPNNLAPTLPTNVTIDTSSSINDVIQQAQSEQQAAPVSKRLFSGLFDICPTKVTLPSTLGNIFVPQALTTWLFSCWPTFASSANKAKATLDNGKYTQVYKNLQATYVNPSSNSFLGMSTLWSYDVGSCSTRCSKLKGCMSFEVSF